MSIKNTESGFLFPEMERQQQEETEKPQAIPDQKPRRKVKTPLPKRGWEITNCQYCQDVGPCMYCSRGRQENRESKRPKKS